MKSGRFELTSRCACIACWLSAYLERTWKYTVRISLTGDNWRETIERWWRLWIRLTLRWRRVSFNHNNSSLILREVIWISRLIHFSVVWGSLSRRRWRILTILSSILRSLIRSFIQLSRIISAGLTPILTWLGLIQRRSFRSRTIIILSMIKLRPLITKITIIICWS